MSVEAAAENGAHEGGVETQVVNGMSNGHHSSNSNSSSRHKSSSKDKHRDKEREHKSSSSHKSSSRDKEKHSSSSSGKDKHRDKDHHGSSSHRDKDKKKDRSDKDKERSDKDKHRSSSSSHHHKSSSKDKDRSKDKEKDRERKENSSSSSSKDKHKSSSSSSSHDKHRDKQKERHHKSSSSSRHRHSSSSTHSKTDSSSRPMIIEDGFLKPEPLSAPPTNIIVPPHDFSNTFLNNANGFVPGANGLNIANGSSNGYNDEKLILMKQELSNQYFDVSQTSSCDYSMSQFKDDEPAFVVKEEASLDGDDDEEFIPDESQQPQLDQTNEEEDGEEDDTPLAIRSGKRPAQQVEVKKEEEETDDEEDIPLFARRKMRKEEKKEKKKVKDKSKVKRVKIEEDDYEMEEKPKKKLKNQTDTKVKQENASPTKRKKKEEEDVEVWRWWEEEKRDDGVKWSTLEHRGPVFAPLYERLPRNVRFYYDGKPLELSEETEEAATFYAKMLNHDYCTKSVFNQNFFNDFRKSMTSKERETIKDFKKCNFMEMHQYFLAESEKRKNSTKEEKERRKQENEEMIKEYGFCWIDGHKEKIGNFRLEPPGLFRGRGEHPKMGMIKRRIRAEDISINCGKESKKPVPPSGHKWKDVRHDNTVTWLASWTENVQGQVKYIMLNPSSKLKGEKDHVKYETARKLDKCIDKIRSTYREEWKAKEMRVRQRAVALYFIDKLALRAGNEKDEDQADTVGCCSLRVEHIALHKELNGKQHVVVFDFPGKDSIRYYNEVEVEKRVFKNLELFVENKKEGDDLFDRLNTQVLNEHLKELMDGLTAKVFRTYNASITLQNQLDLLTKEEMSVEEKLLAYNRANRAVAILCNHQRSVPKSHQKSMENLKEKIRAKRELLDNAEVELHDLRKAAKRGSVKEKINADKKGKQLERLKQQLKKLELQETDRDENKTIALGTSKLNYLDPRISVAWCKKNEVPIEKIFNKTQRTKFMWAIHMADETYRF